MVEGEVVNGFAFTVCSDVGRKRISVFQAVRHLCTNPACEKGFPVVVQGNRATGERIIRFRYGDFRVLFGALRYQSVDEAMSNEPLCHVCPGRLYSCKDIESKIIVSCRARTVSDGGKKLGYGGTCVSCGFELPWPLECWMGWEWLK